ncbi:MAG TPA: hypothetical protein VFB62_12955 [Polyangiaceae bacterium]|nr:hypothetical protein [Polyangiaceae bacterium]
MTGGGGETGAGGNGQGGASGMNCEDCADGVEGGACQAEFDACMPPQGTPECELWWDCYVDKCMNGDMGGEFTAACFAQCDMDFMGEANLYGPMKTCLCNECGSECLPFCP